MSSEIMGLIVARAGSKRVPDKNVRLLDGIPLIDYTLQSAINSPSLNQIFISTDDDRILEIARGHGIPTPYKRPVELADDNSSVIDATQHAIRWLAREQQYRPDAIMLLQPTSPFRQTQDIEASIRLFESGHPAVVSVSPAQTHPSLMGHIQDEQFVTLAQPSEWQMNPIHPLFQINGAIYLVATELLERTATWRPPNAAAYVMPQERAIDIDTEWDFTIAETLLQQKGYAPS